MYQSIFENMEERSKDIIRKKDVKNFHELKVLSEGGSLRKKLSIRS